MDALKAAAGSVLVAGLTILSTAAAAETVGTACVSGSTGQITGLAPYHTYPATPCIGDQQTVRLALYQPGSRIAKRRGSLQTNFGTITLAEIDSFFFYLDIEFGRCRLRFDDVLSSKEYVIIDVGRGSWQQGIQEVVETDYMDDTTIKYYTDKMVLTYEATFVFHDALVDYRSDECFAGFFVEWTEDPRELYAE
jgi:hypothetical protein